MQHHQRLAFIGLVDTKLMHDLRAPIISMRHLSHTLASLFNEKSPDHGQIHSISNYIHQKANNALSFISSFRAQLMQEGPRLSKVNIVNIVKEAVSLITLSTEKKVEINQRIDEKLSCLMDKNRFLSVLVNILQNSVDSFSAEGLQSTRKVSPGDDTAGTANKDGRIEITGEVRDGYIQLSITDNGCGIRKEYIERIFDSFYTTKSNGMGLGLFFVKQEVEQYGGSVSCISKEGSGTTITIALPPGKEKR